MIEPAMTELSKELRVEYNNSLGMKGVEKYWRKENISCKRGQMAWFSMKLMCLAIGAFVLTHTSPLKSSPLDICVTIIMLIITFLFVFTWISSLALEPVESVNSVYLTELIEKDGLDYITAQVYLDTERDFQTIIALRTHNKDKNVFNTIRLENGFEFTEDDTPKLSVTAHTYKLTFPQNALFEIQTHKKE